MYSPVLANQINLTQRTNFDKQNNVFTTRINSTSRQQLQDPLFKQFQTLKQINRIIDSNPESQQAKDQKIRSLVVMFKRQFDINTKLQTQIQDLRKVVQGYEHQASIRNIQVKTYEKTIFEQKEKILALQSQNRKQLNTIRQNQEQIQIRQELIEKMKQNYLNQKVSMENQLHYLKQKTLEHFTQKLNFPLTSVQEKRPINNSCSRPKSSDKKPVSKPSKKKNIIQRNIKAISQKQQNLMSGQNLFKKFEETKKLNERLEEIRKGNYHSALSNLNHIF